MAVEGLRKNMMRIDLSRLRALLTSNGALALLGAVVVALVVAFLLGD